MPDFSARGHALIVLALLQEVRVAHAALDPELERIQHARDVRKMTSLARRPVPDLQARGLGGSMSDRTAKRPSTNHFMLFPSIVIKLPL